MDRRAIRGTRHQPVEHVELANQMALADPADRRIARHLPDVLGAEGEQPDARAAPRRGSRSLAAGMAGADDQNVVHVVGALAASMFHVKHHLPRQKRRTAHRARPRPPRARSADRTPSARMRRSSATRTRSRRAAAPAKRVGGFADMHRLPPIERNRVLGRQHAPRERLDPLEQRAEALARHRRHRERSFRHTSARPARSALA